MPRVAAAAPIVAVSPSRRRTGALPRDGLSAMKLLGVQLRSKRTAYIVQSDTDGSVVACVGIPLPRRHMSIVRFPLCVDSSDCSSTDALAGK